MVKPTTALAFVNGKNLLNKDGGFYLGYCTDSGIVSNNNNALLSYVPVNANTQYTLSTALNCSGYGFGYYDKNYNYLERTTGANLNQQTITTPNNCAFVRVWINYNNNTMTQTVINDLQPQLEQNSSATSYEAYTPKKIYTKNGNGTFEEFAIMEEDTMSYSILGTSNITSSLTVYNSDVIDFNKYRFIVVQIGAGTEGDSAVFIMPPNVNGANYINSTAHLDMYASDSYRCRAFANFQYGDSKIRVTPKQLVGWTSVPIKIVGVYK